MTVRWWQRKQAVQARRQRPRGLRLESLEERNLLSFAPAVNYPVVDSPVTVGVGDFNGDGNLDLAVSDFFNANKVSILLGNGDGTFQSHVDYATGHGAASVVVADFNGDGTPDLAVSNYFDGTVSVLFGNGDGTFQPAA